MSPSEQGLPEAGQRFDLAALQQWMLGAITELPRENSTGIAEPGAVGPITASRLMTSEDRLGIYQRAYLARLLEVLREEYSVLCRALGEELFDRFAVEYLQQYPSESYTLARLGDRFVAFLQETAPVSASDSSEAGADWSRFFIDIARLEQVVNQVFDGPGTEDSLGLTTDDLARLSAEQWSAATLQIACSLRLVETRFPVNDYFSAILRREQPQIPEPATAWVAVSRRDFRIERRELSLPQYRLLKSLQDGLPVGEAVFQAAVDSGIPAAEFADRLQKWFAEWTAAVFFTGVSRSNCGPADGDESSGQ